MIIPNNMLQHINEKYIFGCFYPVVFAVKEYVEGSLVNQSEGSEIKSLILDEGIVEEAKKASLQFKELVVTAMILALAVNLLSDIIWSIGEATTLVLSSTIKAILFVVTLVLLVYLYNDLARIHTRAIREIYRTFSESIYIDSSRGIIPEIPFVDSQNCPLHSEAASHFEHLDDTTKERVVRNLKGFGEKHRWECQYISSHLFSALLLLYHLGFRSRVPYYPQSQVKVSDIVSNETPFLDEKDRNYFGLQIPGTPYYKLEIDKYGNGLLTINWRGRAKSTVRIAFSSSSRKPHYIELRDETIRLDGELLSSPIEHESLVRVDVRFEVSANFNHICLVREWCSPQFRWAVSLMKEFWN